MTSYSPAEFVSRAETEQPVYWQGSLLRSHDIILSAGDSYSALSLTQRGTFPVATITRTLAGSIALPESCYNPSKGYDQNVGARIVSIERLLMCFVIIMLHSVPCRSSAMLEFVVEEYVFLSTFPTHCNFLKTHSVNMLLKRSALFPA
jgi:hypothetical protein